MSGSSAYSPDDQILAEFMLEVEDHFDMDIPLNVLSETHTMKDLISVVQAGKKV